MHRVVACLIVVATVGCAARSPHRPAAASEAAARATDEELHAVCEDLDGFRRLAARGAPPDTRAALLRWAPPSPVAASDRPAVIAVLRRWTALCARDAAAALAARLIALPTVSAEQSAADGAAFVAMAELLEQWATESGLGFRVSGANDAWEITLGQGPASVAYVLHADVVPAADEPAADGALPAGWSVPPFAPVIREGRLWGRGAEDDKGPAAAVLIVMRLLAAAGLSTQGRIAAVLGTGEENDWDGMRRYADSGRPGRFVVSLDASFPVVVAENGFVAFRIGAPLGPTARRRGRSRDPVRARAVDARAGAFLTQVPGDAMLVLEPGTHESVDGLLARARTAATGERERGGSFGATAEQDGDRVVIRATGRAIHSSIADQGENALWVLAAVAAQLDLEPGGITDVLRVVHDRFDGDHWGERLGLSYEHPLMGRLLVTPTVLRIEDGRAVLGINMRRPAGQSSAEFSAHLDAALEALRRDISPRLLEVGERYVGEPHVADTSGPLVDTLMSIYRAHGGAPDATPIAIRGGTYARLFPGAVSFGPEWPGEGYRGHAPDEWIDLDALGRYTAMILDATLALDALPAPDAPSP